MRWIWAVCAVILFIVSGRAIVNTQSSTPETLPRVAAGDLRYLGSFNVPIYDGSGTSETSQLMYGGWALGIGRNGTSLYFGCHAWHPRLAEVSIPSIGGTAQVLTRCQNLPNVNQVAPGGGTVNLGGSLTWNGRLLVSAYAFYDANAESRSSHLVGLPSISGFSGPFRVGTEDSGMIGGYMTVVPQEWRTLLGGAALTGQGALSIISRSSQGPALFAFDPDTVGTVSTAPAAPLAFYPYSSTPSNNHPLANDSQQNDLYTRADDYGGLAFPAGTRSVLVVGVHGAGRPCYGEGSECSDPARSGKGEHAYPYVHQVWAFDANDLVKVRQGQLSPWAVRPYATWRLTEMNNSGSARVASATFDPVSRRLYVTEEFGDRPKVHVYEINVGTAPPPNPTTQPLGAAPTSLAFSKVQGQANPAAKTVTVTAAVGQVWETHDTMGVATVSGAGCVSNGGDGVRCTGSAVITITPASGMTNLAAGTYNLHVRLTSTGQADVTVPVTVTVTAPPPPTPVSCVVSSWSTWQGGSWSACQSGTQSRTETRTRTIVTPASNGGAACPVLSETRTATQACVTAPPPEVCGDRIDNDNDGQIDEGCPVACAVSAWGAWQPASDWSACASNGIRTRSELRARTVVTPAANGGTACPMLQEARTATSACAAAPPPPSPPPPTPPAPAPPPPPTEVCHDGLDNDGDGAIDEDCPAPLPTAPGAPVQLTSRVQGTTVGLSWLEPITGGSPTQYLIEAGSASGATAVTLPMPSAQTSVQIPNVGYGKYFVRVRASNDVGIGPASNETVLTVGCALRPSKPRSFVARIRGGLVTLAWDDSDGCADTRYRVVVGSAPGAANIGAFMAQGRTLTAMAPPGRYFARVVALTDNGESEPADEIEIPIESAACTPTPVALVLTASVHGGRVSLSWQPTNPTAAHAADEVSPLSYLLEAGTAPGLANIAQLPLGRATSLSTFVPGGVYHVRVRPVDACGPGAASNEQILRVP